MSALQGSPASPEGTHTVLEQTRPAPQVPSKLQASPASPVGALGPVSAALESSVLASLIVPLGPESAVPLAAPPVAPEPVPVLTPALAPVLVPALTPVLDPALAPVLVPALTPVLDPALAPVLVPALDPALVPDGWLEELDPHAASPPTDRSATAAASGQRANAPLCPLRSPSPSRRPPKLKPWIIAKPSKKKATDQSTQYRPSASMKAHDNLDLRGHAGCPRARKLEQGLLSPYLALHRLPKAWSGSRMGPPP
jgi:hypothetical protein